MKVIVIGGQGHIGSYLVPKLVKTGYEVTVISRGKSRPYVEDNAWNKVEHLLLDRDQEEKFAHKVASLNGDIIIDLINFSLNETEKMVQALKETKLSHYLFCSSIWAHGRAEMLPADPNSLKHPLDDYGIQKYESEKYLKEEYLNNGFPATVIMPGQISGPGWTIINPLGNLNNNVFQQIADGEEICLPNLGMETLHHVHANDVAQMFVNAITHRNQALGESFHAVAEESMTLYGYATRMFQFFGQEPNIKFLPWEKWCEYVKNEDDIDKTYYHIARSGQYSIDNAKKLIDYSPKYSTQEVVEESMKNYIERNVITIE
ncbi:NAD-dependent epimerase/dehydratase family protein [Oceanobacillus neutriphilus]|uniref:NAD-dependent epimerase/dehydratase domain-containing protein n=1 Tax=Oceanobacillus neutriphilus TaxID=531815 RepID=A0ABQ2NU55_9BACI|nr:NAD-dependent epimerase/dehydratase family protein [Oceanobacillus neutriphilus]GGP10589.1 hypothetical protein GCM10011346_19320 [Oceanobacillus neutriphilus]